MSAKASALAVLVLLAVLTSGCMYGNEIKQQYAPPTGEYITLVQNAVDAFHQRTGVLPIKNKEQDTPVYEKYVIDFKKLVENRLLTAIPANAFENGGTAVYVLVNPETKPEVKLIDLTVYQKLVDLQRDADQYLGKTGSLPLGQQIAGHFYTLDFKKLGRKAEQVPSPFSRMYLSVIINDEGTVGIDYGPEIGKAAAGKGGQAFAPDYDLRTLLVEQAYFVPARSFPYHWVNGEPALSLK